MAVPSVLSYSLIAAEHAQPKKWLLFLHGIFGSGANWRTMARRIVEAQPQWGAALIDLRMHGGSLHSAPPHTLHAAASDLIALETTLPGPVCGVIGHSFGGKVALEYLSLKAKPLECVWVLDASPSARQTTQGTETTLDVLCLLEKAVSSGVFLSRQAFVQYIFDGGHTLAIANWLAMNLRHTGDGYQIKLDLSAIRSLLDDYFAQNLWNALEPPPPHTRIVMILGGQSQVVDTHDRQRLTELAERWPERLQIHVLPRAAHWVHVDDPEGVLALILKTIDSL